MVTNYVTVSINNVKRVVEMAIGRVEKIKPNQILFGLGDWLSNSMKDFVKVHLKEDVLLELKMRLMKI